MKHPDVEKAFALLGKSYVVTKPRYFEEYNSRQCLKIPNAKISTINSFNDFAPYRLAEKEQGKVKRVEEPISPVRQSSSGGT